MLFSKIINKQVTGLIVAAAAITYLTVALICRPIVCSDALNGMVSLANYLKGSEWNTTLGLTAGDATIVSKPLTWWAPGQYQIPFLLSRLFTVNIGTAISILLVSSLLGGAYFYYRVLQRSGVNEQVILVAILILVSQRFINIFFVQYSSPDLFLFLLTPLYIYSYLRLPESSVPVPVSTLLLLLLNLAGLFIKSSFILFELAFNVFLIIELWRKNRQTNNLKAKAAGAILLILPFIAANLLNYIYFLRLGINPAQSNGLAICFNDILTGIFTPVIQTLLGSLSLSAIYGNLREKINLTQPWDSILMSMFLFVVCRIIYKTRAQLFRLYKQDRVFRMMAVVVIAYIIYWFIFTVRRSAVSAEDRLFLPVSIFMLPYLLQSAYQTSAVVRYSCGIALCISIWFGLYTFINRVRNYAVQGAVMSENKLLSGFRVYGAEHDFENINRISSLIRSSRRNDAIVVLNPSLVFRLNLENKFIVTPAVPGEKAAVPSVPYFLLLEGDGSRLPSRLKKIYASGKFSLYESGR